MKKKLLLIAGGLVLVVGLIGGLYLAQHPQLLKRQAANRGGAVLMTISPTAVSQGVNTNFSLVVSLDTKGKSINGLQFVLKYPSTGTGDFKVVNISLDTALIASGWKQTTPGPSGQQDPPGQISFAATYNGEYTSSGTVPVATITLKAPAATKKTISFDPANSSVSAAGGRTDILSDSLPSVKVNIGGGTVPETPLPPDSPTPAVPSPSPSPSPTPLPTPDVPGVKPTISNISEGAILSRLPAKITGTAQTGASLTINVYSGEIMTGAAIADTDGNWSWKPTTTILTDGEHSLVVSDSASNSATVNFTIKNSLPATGATENTLIIITAGIFALLAGGLLLAR